MCTCAHIYIYIYIYIILHGAHYSTGGEEGQIKGGARAPWQCMTIKDAEGVYQIKNRLRHAYCRLSTPTGRDSRAWLRTARDARTVVDATDDRGAGHHRDDADDEGPRVLDLETAEWLYIRMVVRQAPPPPPTHTHIVQYYFKDRDNGPGVCIGLAVQGWGSGPGVCMPKDSPRPSPSCRTAQGRCGGGLQRNHALNEV